MKQSYYRSRTGKYSDSCNVETCLNPTYIFHVIAVESRDVSRRAACRLCIHSSCCLDGHVARAEIAARGRDRCWTAMAHIAIPRHPLRSHSTASGVYRPPPNGRPASARLPVRPSPRETAKQPLYRRLLFPRNDPDRPVRRIIQGKGDDIDEVNERSVLDESLGMN